MRQRRGVPSGIRGGAMGKKWWSICVSESTRRRGCKAESTTAGSGRASEGNRYRKRGREGFLRVLMSGVRTREMEPARGGVQSSMSRSVDSRYAACGGARAWGGKGRDTTASSPHMGHRCGSMPVSPISSSRQGTSAPSAGIASRNPTSRRLVRSVSKMQRASSRRVVA